MQRCRWGMCGMALWLGSSGVAAEHPAPVPTIRLELPVLAGRVQAVVPLRLKMTAPDVSGEVGIEGEAELALLDAGLVDLLRAALGSRPPCRLQIDVRRAWLSVEAPQRVRLDVRGRVTQPLCGKLREVFGGPLDGPSSRASAALMLRLLVDAEGRPLVFVERVELGTGRRDLDLLLHALRPPEELRAGLQAALDAALAQWPPPLLADFVPRLRSMQFEQSETGALRMRLRGSFRAGPAQWWALWSRLRAGS